MEDATRHGTRTAETGIAPAVGRTQFREEADLAAKSMRSPL